MSVRPENTPQRTESRTDHVCVTPCVNDRYWHVSHTEGGMRVRLVAGGKQRAEDVLHLVEAVLPAVEACHVVASRLVVEGQ
jgi:2-C-methyl-D-erythritol 4-phosphate cytidylyltransferase